MTILNLNDPTIAISGTAMNTINVNFFACKCKSTYCIDIGYNPKNYYPTDSIYKFASRNGLRHQYIKKTTPKYGKRKLYQRVENTKTKDQPEKVFLNFIITLYLEYFEN